MITQLVYWRGYSISNGRQKATSGYVRLPLEDIELYMKGLGREFVKASTKKLKYITCTQYAHCCNASYVQNSEYTASKWPEGAEL